MSKQQEMLRNILAVDEILQLEELHDLLEVSPRMVVVEAIRLALDEVRQEIISAENDSALERIDIKKENLIKIIHKKVEETMASNLSAVINATGVVIHTNLGRSILAGQAIEEIVMAARCYTNLEYDLETGERGSRYKLVEDIICHLTGAEAAIVVNNNAGAVLLSLSALASGKEVIVSRGELVEIGGSFRIPDVMRQSGARLAEVGATNKTHLADYKNAIREETALLMKVHTSNFRVVGFMTEVSREELVKLGHQHNLPVIEDLGSGILIDLNLYGLTYEPTVKASIGAGVDLVTFSGDKLLGGPQAGIIVGRKELIKKIGQHPLTRALRVDKFTLAGLEATFKIYLDEAQAVEEIPTLRMLLTPANKLKARAKNLAVRLKAEAPNHLVIGVDEDISRVGGGALPLEELPTHVVTVESNNLKLNELEEKLRHSNPPLLVRLKEDRLIIDMRTVLPEEEDTIVSIFKNI